MKQPINEIRRMQQLAGLINESEYQESLTNEDQKPQYAKTIKWLSTQKMKPGDLFVRYINKDSDKEEELEIDSIEDLKSNRYERAIIKLKNGEELKVSQLASYRIRQRIN
jgi:hypothetical protein